MEESIKETRNVLSGITPMSLVLDGKDVNWDDFINPKDDIAFAERLA